MIRISSLDEKAQCIDGKALKIPVESLLGRDSKQTTAALSRKVTEIVTGLVTK